MDYNTNFSRSTPWLRRIIALSRSKPAFCPVKYPGCTEHDKVSADTV